jgi:ornithine decarboxylase
LVKGDSVAACGSVRETPFFVISRERLLTAYHEFETCFPGAAIHYAMKANSDRNVLRALARAGAGFEVASAHELRLLRSVNVPAAKIIYGSSIKPASHIRECHEYGVDRFAVDSVPEIDKIAAAAPGARVYVRVRVDDSGSVFRFSEKFGADAESAVGLLRHALKQGLRAYGISFHVGSQAGSFAAWANAIRYLSPALVQLENAGITIETLNIGGGYPCRYRSAPDAPSLRDITRSVVAAYADLPYQPDLILEPGRGIVGDAAVLVTGVIGRVERHGTVWLFLDAGVYNALYEALAFQGSTGYPITSPLGSGVQTARFCLAGPTGDSHDVIGRDILLPAETTVGDVLTVHSVGAYSLSVASAFNGFPLPSVHFVETDLPEFASPL